MHYMTCDTANYLLNLDGFSSTTSSETRLTPFSLLTLPWCLRIFLWPSFGELDDIMPFFRGCTDEGDEFITLHTWLKEGEREIEREIINEKKWICVRSEIWI